MGGIDQGAGAALAQAAVQLFRFDGNNTSDGPPLPGDRARGDHVSLAQGHVLPLLRLEKRFRCAGRLVRLGRYVSGPFDGHLHRGQTQPSRHRRLRQPASLSRHSPCGSRCGCRKRTPDGRSLAPGTRERTGRYYPDVRYPEPRRLTLDAHSSDARARVGERWLSHGSGQSRPPATRESHRGSPRSKRKVAGGRSHDQDGRADRPPARGSARDVSPHARSDGTG